MENSAYIDYGLYFAGFLCLPGLGMDLPFLEAFCGRKNNKEGRDNHFC